MRSDQSSATVRLHYLADGNVSFAFTINRAEYFIPVALLLRGLAEVPSSRTCPKCGNSSCSCTIIIGLVYCPLVRSTFSSWAEEVAAEDLFCVLTTLNTLYFD